MFHLLYIIAFAVIAFFAASSMIRSMSALSGNGSGARRSQPSRKPQHPELLDERGRAIDEPLLVMRSMSVEDAREQLNALYDSSPGGSTSRDDDNPDATAAG